MRRFILAACSTVTALTLVAFVAPGCGSDDSGSSSSGGNNGDGGGCVGFGCTDGTVGPKPGCIGLECNQVACENNAKTTLSGRVLDPAGKVPIFNAVVYVANADPAAITTGATCDRCQKITGTLTGAVAQTDVEGKFTIENVPVVGDGKTIPVVVQIGKWRRVFQVKSPTACQNTEVDVGEGAGVLRLPKNRTEGNIPRIAVATGAADPLQCLFRKIGLEDGEFGVKGSEARVHLYQGGGYTLNAVPQTATKSVGTTPMTNAEALWGSLDELKAYDLVVLACEGTENDSEAHKPGTAKTALYEYAKAGGRVFTSHYHHTFFSSANAPADTQGTATWRTAFEPPAPGACIKPPNPNACTPPGSPSTTAVNATFPNLFPKAAAMKDWLTRQNALVNGELPIFDARHNLDSVVAGKALNWLEVTNPNVDPQTKAVQYMTFSAPVGAPEDQICGRVVFSDLHVGAGGSPADNPTDSEPFPTGCKTTELSAQQKALEFMLFDLSSCVQKDDEGVQIPK